jgi:hypothetical protein
VSDREVVEHARGAQVERCVPGANGSLGEGAGGEGLAGAGEADDEQVLASGDPLRRGEAEDHGAIEAAGMVEVVSSTQATEVGERAIVVLASGGARRRRRSPR